MGKKTLPLPLPGHMSKKKITTCIAVSTPGYYPGRPVDWSYILPLISRTIRQGRSQEFHLGGINFN